jgi:SAM-dependent methyltransferase
VINQCRKPTGWLGRFVLWVMNLSHSRLTDWGLGQISVGIGDAILDVGCGGGRTVSKLAALTAQGKVYGIDYSAESVAASKRTNAQGIDAGRVEIRQGEVAQLAFSDGVLDLVTGVETHFWWPDLPGGVREVFRVLKPGGMLVLIAEVYRGVEGEDRTTCAEVRFTNGDEAVKCGGASRALRRGGLLGCSDCG